MAFNFSSKAVTDGLVLYLDAANSKSIVSGSTTWNDLSRGGNNGTLVNGPTFSSASGGAIVLDGSNDYVGTSNIQVTSNFTYDFIFDTSNLTNNTINDLVKGTAGYGGQNVSFHLSNTNSIFVNSTLSDFSGYIYFTGYNWFTNRGLHHYTVTIEYTTSTIFKLYVDGVLKDTQSSNNYNNYLPAFNSISYADGVSYSAYLFRLYNRTLSATEVLQNYNATKARFGL
jgi:hypothetical protein